MILAAVWKHVSGFFFINTQRKLRAFFQEVKNIIFQLFIFTKLHRKRTHKHKSKEQTTGKPGYRSPFYFHLSKILELNDSIALVLGKSLCLTRRLSFREADATVKSLCILLQLDKFHLQNETSKPFLEENGTPDQRRSRALKRFVCNILSLRTHILQICLLKASWIKEIHSSEVSLRYKILLL